MTGPAIIDVSGFALTADDKRRLKHPATGGIIFFARNFQDPAQLRDLVTEIRAERNDVLICVDHEGGRVQRFRDGFTAVPAMQRIGESWDADQSAALAAAVAAGLVIGTELRTHGIDFSFAPVLDLDYGGSSVIGDRALHSDPAAVGALAAALVRGLADAGMAAVGKHFPGHGYATADSHVAVPTDDRPLDEILRKDAFPYIGAISAGLAGVMPAHVIYTQVDPEPAGYSFFWLKDVLRSRLGFGGIVFSDDLSMEGASTVGGIPARAGAALAAGCDMVILCNDPAGQDSLLESLARAAPIDPGRLAKMRSRPADTQTASAEYTSARKRLEAFS